MLYLKKILACIDRISLKEISPPKGKVGPGEMIVGTLPDDLKKMYAVMEMMRAEVNALIDEGNKRFGALNAGEQQKQEDEIIKLNKQLHLARNEYKLIERCFWDDMHLNFPNIVPGLVGLRQEWQVVTVDAKEELMKAFCDAIWRLFGEDINGNQ